MKRKYAQLPTYFLGLTAGLLALTVLYGVLRGDIHWYWPERQAIPVVSVLITTLLLTAWLGSFSVKANLSLMLTAIFLGLVTLETVCFLLPPIDIAPRYWQARKLGLPYDTHSKAQALEAKRRVNNSAYLAVFPTAFGQSVNISGRAGDTVVPLAGIAQVETIFCNETGTYSTYAADEYGFNNPTGLHSQNMDIAVVGDSYVQGACVAAEYNITGHIRRKHPKTINLGISSNGSLRNLAMLHEYAADVRPKTVFWFYYEGNDLGELRNERADPVMAKYMQSPDFRQGLKGRQAEIDTFMKQYIDNHYADYKNYQRLKRFLKFSDLRDWLGFGFASRETPPIQDWTIEEQVFAEIVMKSKQKIESWGGRMIFVYLGVPYHYLVKDYQLLYASRERVLAIAKKAGLPIVDLYELVSTHPDPLSLYALRMASHFNERGYQYVADAMLRYMEKPVAGSGTEQ